MNGRKNMRYDERPSYPETLPEQIKALENDDQMEYFKDARRRLSSDPYRPQYHFCRPDGYLNDPNGLCFWEGKWHLFYQANDTFVHWGHAVSDDLIFWRDLPFAIYPKYEDHCFSGGTLVDTENHRVIAAHYGFTGYDPEKDYRCGTTISVSSDPLLLNWTKINDGKPVIPDKDAPCWTQDGAPDVPGQKPYQVFDTCIWKEGKTYFILEAGYFRHKVTGRRFRQMHLLKCENDDLLHWEFVNHFLDNDTFRELGDDGACPYFTKIGNKYLLSHFSHRCSPKYLIGDYDENTHEFFPFSAGKYASGFGILVAPSVANLDADSAAVIFNTVEQKPIGEWGGTFTLPRKLTIGGVWGDELYSSPAVDLSPLYLNGQTRENINLPSEKTVVFEGIESNCFEADFIFKADKIPNTLEIEVLRSPDGEERTVISFLKHRGGGYAIQPYTQDSIIMADTSHSSNNPQVSVTPPEIFSLVKEGKEDLELKIFVDRSTLEVFANGKVCIAMRAYPERADSRGIAIRARGCDGELCRMDFHEIGTIYEGE